MLAKVAESGEHGHSFVWQTDKHSSGERRHTSWFIRPHQRHWARSTEDKEGRDPIFSVPQKKTLLFQEALGVIKVLKMLWQALLLTASKQLELAESFESLKESTSMVKAYLIFFSNVNNTCDLCVCASKYMKTFFFFVKRRECDRAGQDTAEISKLNRYIYISLNLISEVFLSYYYFTFQP